jgi:hypothetical protein
LDELQEAFEEQFGRITREGMERVDEHRIERLDRIISTDVDYI